MKEEAELLSLVTACTLLGFNKWNCGFAIRYVVYIHACCFKMR